MINLENKKKKEAQGERRSPIRTVLIRGHLKNIHLPCLLTDFDHSKNTRKSIFRGKISVILVALSMFFLFLMNIFQNVDPLLLLVVSNLVLFRVPYCDVFVTTFLSRCVMYYISYIHILFTC